MAILRVSQVNVIIRCCIVAFLIGVIYIGKPYGIAAFYQMRFSADDNDNADTPEVTAEVTAEVRAPGLTAANECPTHFKLPAKRKSYSQSREDLGLFSRYFSEPLMCNGTFLEIGALDGIKYSNTLFFEKYLGWSGVLIEANPDNSKKLMKNRHTTRNFAMAVCDEGVKTLKFQGKSAVGGVIGEMTDRHRKGFKIDHYKVIEIPCQPLSWILKQANVKQLDFFSLDVEGSEYFVIKTMDWSVPVRVFVIEVHLSGKDPELVKRDNLVRDLLRENGYVKETWNIMSFCPRHGSCGGNEVWVNPNYPNIPNKT